MAGINYIPFYYQSLDAFLNREVFYNILLSVPFGFGIPFLMRVNHKRILLLAVMFGTTIELLQLAISLVLGFTYRSPDINDVILNFLGAMVGFGLFYVFHLFTVKPNTNTYGSNASPFLSLGIVKNKKKRNM